MTMSVYLANKINDHVLKGVVYTPPTDVYIALFTSANGLDSNTEGSWDEVSGGAYTRLQIDDSTKAFTASAAKANTNNENWEYTQASAAWGVVSHSAVMDAATSGNVLFWGALAATRDVASGDTFRFLAGEFDSIFT